ncbi:MAG: hypothetical protein QNJ40_16765 [Xanthomonadales bacterium]|nr:hypothetical protein [Xanthomonadales bacterium]
MIYVLIAGFSLLLAVAASVLVRSQAPAVESRPSSTRLHLSTMERTYGVPEDRC